MDRDDLRERLLCEAERAFLEQGFFGVSLRQIATNAGVHPRTLTVLFGGKHNLLKLVEARLRDRPGGAADGPAVTDSLDGQPH